MLHQLQNSHNYGLNFDVLLKFNKLFIVLQDFCVETVGCFRNRKMLSPRKQRKPEVTLEKGDNSLVFFSTLLIHTNIFGIQRKSFKNAATYVSQ